MKINTMDSASLLKHFKYYKGEENSPYGQNSTENLWWSGEKHIYENVLDDVEFFERITHDYQDALENGYCKGVLTDKTIPEIKRVIMFYLDLWHGKWFPYDNLDVIFTY